MFENPMVYPPLGLFVIKAVLQEHGHSVDYFDMSEFTVETDGTRITKRENPPLGYDAYMIGGTSPQAQEIMRLARFLRDNDCLVIGGGPHVTNNAGPATTTGLSIVSSVENIDSIKEKSRKSLLETFHLLIKYEGERAVLKALERLEEAQKRMKIFGQGIVIEEPLIPQAEMGEIPIPDREYADQYKAYLEDSAGNIYPTTTMFSSRGCPERCAFCDSPALWGRAMRYAPMDRVQEELQDINDRGFKGVYFYDDILFLNKKRAMELYDKLHSFGFVSRGNMRTDVIAKDHYGFSFLEHMRDRGLVDVFVGVESGSNQIKANIHKGTTIEQDSLVLKWCKELGIKFKASVIFGLPGETKETMEATKRWVLENRPDKVNACLFIPFSGIPIVKGVNLARGIQIDDDRAKQYGQDAIHDYDIQWSHTTDELEQYFYAGSRKPGAMRALVSTSAVSAQEIQDSFDDFLRDLEKEKIPF